MKNFLNIPQKGKDPEDIEMVDFSRREVRSFIRQV